MTGAPVAPQSRELVIPREVLLALGAVARGEGPAGFGTALTDAGLLTPDGRPTEIAAPTAEAVGSPVATLRITAVDPDGTRGGDGWVGERRAVLHPGGSGPAPVVSVGRSLLPQLVVRTTGLGPRPVADGPAFEADAADVAAACAGTGPAPWPGEATRPRLWRLTWQAGDDAAGDLAVLDLGAQGLWRPGPGQGTARTWSPVSATAVWRELGRLFAVTMDDRPAS